MAVLALTTAVRAAIVVSAAIVLWLALVAMVAGYERWLIYGRGSKKDYAKIEAQEQDLGKVPSVQAAATGCRELRRPRPAGRGLADRESAARPRRPQSEYGARLRRRAKPCSDAESGGARTSSTERPIERR